jgi:hypothetical protein
MAAERRRATRHPLTAGAEIIELQTETHIKARASDFSRDGCYIDTMNPLPQGTDVKLQITHEEETFTAFGTVAHSESNMGMGIRFTLVEPGQHEVLQKWLDGISGDVS